MNDRHFKYILEIVKEGSVTAAAENLHISQPSLSNLLATVEDEIGARIFDRTVIPLSLTYEGELYVEAVTKILGMLRDFQTKINDMKESISGRFSIGCGYQQSPYIISTLFPVLTEKYPAVEFKFEEQQNPDHLEEFLLRGMLDAVLCIGKINNTNVECLPIRKEAILLLAPGDFIPSKLRHTKGREYPLVDFALLKEKNFVLMKKGHRLRVLQDTILKDNGCIPNIVLETDSWLTCLRLVERGVAFTLLPNIKSETARTQAISYSLNGDYWWTLYLCYRKNAYYSRIMDGFVKTTLNLFSDPAP
ncbi:MAG: LysR family transcriptional regulator [Treponema sp.]|nr:LysR family transcriptional regulator [Treponema sp.]